MMAVPEHYTDEDCYKAVMGLDLKVFNYVDQQVQSLGPIAQDCPEWMVVDVGGVLMLDLLALIDCMKRSEQHAQLCNG